MDQGMGSRPIFSSLVYYLRPGKRSKPIICVLRDTCVCPAMIYLNRRRIHLLIAFFIDSFTADLILLFAEAVLGLFQITGGTATS